MPLIRCAHCDRAFAVKPSHASKRKYCSRACQAMGFSTQLIGVANPNFGKYRRVRPKDCKICGVSFKSYQKKLTCSAKCLSRLLSNREIERRKNNFWGTVVRTARPRLGKRCTCKKCGANFRNPTTRVRCDKCRIAPTAFSCIICGDSFIRKYSLTCSPKCASKHKSERQKGNKSHRWKGGVETPEKIIRESCDYGNWRTNVFKRDNYTCRHCLQVGGRLTAHHILPFSKFPELRMEISNGVTLCRPCHRKTHNKVPGYELWTAQAIA